MIVRTTLSQGFELVWDGDPALDREASDFENALRVARDTGDYSTVTKPGAQATVFAFKAIRGMRLRALLDRSGQVGAATAAALAFRMALSGIKNTSGDWPAVKLSTDGAWSDLGPMCSDDVIAALDDVNPIIVQELGAVVLTRSMSPRPLS